MKMFSKLQNGLFQGLVYMYSENNDSYINKNSTEGSATPARVKPNSCQ